MVRAKVKKLRVDGDVASVPTPKKIIDQLEGITELRIVDFQGNHVMSFWKGEPHQ